MNLGLKEEKGKPKLSHFPPSYWHRMCNEYSYQMAKWFWYGGVLPTLTSIRLHYDPLIIFEWGVNKYPAYNWHKGLKYSECIDAFHRHTSKYNALLGTWEERELGSLDCESGLPHGAHAAWYVVVLNEFLSRGLGINDCPWKVNNE